MKYILKIPLNSFKFANGFIPWVGRVSKSGGNVEYSTGDEHLECIVETEQPEHLGLSWASHFSLNVA